SVNPDEIVAIGAAIQGAMLQIKKGLGTANVVKMLGEITSTDVNPHSLGFVTLKDGELYNSKIISKNTPIPCEKKRSDYTTSYNNQTSLDVYLVQGEDNNPRYCVLLGAYEFYDIPPMPAKKSRLEVIFKYNLNGVVEVEAKDIVSGNLLPKKVKKEKVDLESLLITVTPPQDIALLIDCSGSMSGIIEDAKQAAYSFLDCIGAEYRVGLISFGDPDAHIRAELTRNYAELKRKISALQASGGTPMAMAITLAANEMLKEKGVLNIIVLLTDGQPNDSPSTINAKQQAQNQGIRIITIGVGSGVDSTFLKQIASTPDDYHFVSEGFELESTFVNIATELSGGIMKI
ncbi:MAG: VWA domain-containing protein, partial [Candidatus Desantisbacteria bacterium]